MCKHCDEETVILKQDIISHGSWGWGGDISIKESEASEDTFGLFLDKRDDKTYMRFADLDDCNCLESGEKVEINFCPFCGKKFK